VKGTSTPELSNMLGTQKGPRADAARGNHAVNLTLKTH
jgi:hypothetical protein